VSLRVAAITVAYRGGTSVLAWADALATSLSCTDPDAVQLVAIAVDNALGDGEAHDLRARAPWVQVLDMPGNRGFAAGCNAGIRHAGAVDIIVLINPDVRVHDSFLTSLAALDWPDDVAARGPLVVSPDGCVEQSARGFPRPATALFGRTSLLARVLPGSAAVRRELRAEPQAGATDVDWVSGACIVIPRDRLDRVGALDEGYFMYWEDADWCRRAHAMGLRVVYEPAIAVTHHQGTSSRLRPVLTTIAFHRSALRCWRLHAARSRASVLAAGGLLTARCLLKLSGVGMARLRR
jgi:N-acetylglucosaminyl-diphospho-decaprenol L-rhamnosyltransferase